MKNLIKRALSPFINKIGLKAVRSVFSGSELNEINLFGGSSFTSPQFIAAVKLFRFLLDQDKNILVETKSQCMQELLILYLFKEELFYHTNEKPFTFLESGANNGLKYSNTYFISKNFNCNGCLVEADTVHSELLHLNRSECKIYLNPLGSSNNEIFILNKNKNSLLSATAKHNNTTQNIENLTQPSLTIKSIAKDISCESFDFLSLDIEGNEYDALLGLQNTLFKVAIIEHNNRKKDKTRISKLLTHKGYKVFDYPFSSHEFLVIHENEINILKNFHSLISI